MQKGEGQGGKSDKLEKLPGPLKELWEKKEPGVKRQGHLLSGCRNGRSYRLLLLHFRGSLNDLEGNGQ